MEYYSTLREEVLPCAPTWMDLEDIMISEISETQKDKHFIISLICEIPNCHFILKNKIKQKQWIGILHVFFLPAMRLKE